jgi:phospholipid/cholesterol/gamma-HCH transport system substrate-binding protein
VADLSAASRSIERAAHDVGDQPQSLLFGRSGQPPGPGEAGFAERLKGGGSK